MIARSATRSARSALRSSAGPSFRAPTARVALSRSYATGSSSALPPKSDAPWAIASVIGFGGLFVYLTAPGSKDASHGHGDHKSSDKHDESHDEEESEPEPKEPQELPDGSIEHPEGFVEVKRPEMREDAPEGDKHLDSIKLADEHAFEKQSKVKRERSLPADDTTFKHGVAAAKDGNPISDPKSVVAAAKTAKEEKHKAKTEGAQQDKEDKSESQDKDGESDDE
ncbi:hypothetical protein BCV70DRAFT_161405 [Testicularia cyperi]|uniref:Uncharacterized protein n=1 Tax=Testicularia cyperi TaxID=1882483 RepID=A0A317XQH1_9BASI|nr:hypothetical protein BCV70DRAFT_161405 [Testicularia cyperi]